MATATSQAQQRMDLTTLLLLVAPRPSQPPAFHSIVSARMPCVNNGCRNSTLLAMLTHVVRQDEVRTPALKIASASAATFELAGHRVVPVASGRLLEAPGGSCSPAAGYWIVRRRQGGGE